MAHQKLPSPKQEAILKFIREYVGDHARPPAYREIENAIGASSVSVVSHHVGRLEAAGLLHRQSGVSRGLRLTGEALALLRHFPYADQEPVDVVRFQIRGYIRAGKPVELYDDVYEAGDEEDAIAVDASLLPRQKENLAALRVWGDSMIDSLIQEGDIVIMQAVVEAKDGEMVAAWLRLEQELTLKHFYREGTQIRLQPANQTLDPIYTHAANVQIQGRVVLVVRPSQIH